MAATSMDTEQQFRAVVERCRAVFLQKMHDYGTAWRILRPSSITDQIYIKALRIRNIEERGRQQVSDSVESEYMGILNYCALALIQLELPADAPLELEENEVVRRYDRHIEENIRLLRAKNHDYAEAWRLMRVSSMTDLILQKILRIKQIEDRSGQTLASEGLEANYRDILNYAAFALIRLEEARAETVPSTKS
ncbi:MAG: DUF1599 domain-containing protein [Saprospiraceae bacterium]|nr:DUF1599 domain-containing protein [Saprospiraceae bacterium]MDW8228510.1 DUF1599 domain-containing protein [Saprospiraceae bacterium]